MIRDGDLIRRAVRQALAFKPCDLSRPTASKARTCLIDALRCQFEGRDLPTSLQALAVVAPCAEGVPVIASRRCASAGEAAFAMGTMAASLLREDMHTASISHHGIVVWPTLIALAATTEISGSTLMAAGVVGYELGAALGEALVNDDLARRARPTALTATAGAAIAGAYLLGLDEDAACAAVALAIDASSGLNQWAHAGADEAYFQAGRAAQSAVRSVMLAAAGAFASSSLLDGEAGLFSVHGRVAPRDLGLFAGELRIMAVYNKALPLCNFAQSAGQAALALSSRPDFDPTGIERLAVSLPKAAIRYPGCNYAGPFDRSIQAKMSIPFCVAAALTHGDLSERRFHVLQEPEVVRLASLCTLHADADFTAAFPRRQGARIEVKLAEGQALVSEQDDVVAATADEIYAGLATSARDGLGETRAAALLLQVDRLEEAADMRDLIWAAHLDVPRHAAA